MKRLVCTLLMAFAIATGFAQSVKASISTPASMLAPRLISLQQRT